MAIGDDFTIYYDDRKIIHEAGSTIYSVRQLYSYMQNTFDELLQMDDPVPMSAQTPTEFTLINNWFMNEPSLEYLSGGAIETNGWSSDDDFSGIRVITFDLAAYTPFTLSETGLYFSGDTTEHSGVLLDFDNTDRKAWVRILATGNVFDQVEIAGVIGGGGGTTSAASVEGENLWANIYTLGTITGGTNIYIVQDGEIYEPFWDSNHIDVLIKVKESDAEIDGGIITVFDRKWEALFDHYEIDLTVGGRNAVPLATSDDINNTGVESTVSGYFDITFTFGPTSQNLNNGNGLRPYNVVIDLAGRGVAEFYEYTKFSTRSGSVKELSGLSGDRYRSLEAGVFGETKPAPFGTFAGGNFFGSKAVWIQNYDLNDSQAFQLIDSSGVSQTPPNTVTLEVTKLVSGDSVVVFKLTEVGGPIHKHEYDAQTGNDSADEAVWVKGTISGDTPTVGWVNIDGDVYKYDEWQTGEFHLDGMTLSATYDEDSHVYVPLIYTGAVSDVVQNSLIYGSTVPIIVRVRKLGIQPFEVESTITTAGRSIAAIRTPDNIA
ncbi:MAG: hypothetical protein ACTSQK_02950 [Candidatus Heimdallarchaeota archaeon]